MTKEELLSYDGRLSELPESEKKEAIDFYKSLINCYEKDHQYLIFDSASYGSDYSFEDFLLANLSRKIYQNNKNKYEVKVKQLIKKRTR